MFINEIDVVVCHFPCMDGFTCKYLIDDWCKINQPDHEVIWLDGTHGAAFDFEACRDKQVLMADFSLKREDMERLGSVARNVIVLDHHASAERELAAYVIDSDDVEEDECPFDFANRNIVALFNMDRCGATMVWDYLQTGIEVPLFVQYIEDRDLWRFKLPHSRALTAYIRAHEMTLESWDKLEREFMVKNTLDQAIKLGTFGLQLHTVVVNELADNHSWARVAGHRVPMVNAPVQFGSDVAAELIRRYPNVPFAGYCYVGPRGYGFGLRSEDARRDVAEIAASLGGGGHRNASGFRADCVDWCD